MAKSDELPTPSSMSPRARQRLKVPAYRQRSGYDQAIVTLTDAATGKRRDYWLGTFGAPESREMYHRLLADWETNGRKLPDRPVEELSLGPRRAGITVADLIAQYWRWAKTYYTSSSASGIKSGLRVLRQCYGSADAGSFGPNALRIVRDAMVLGREANGEKRARPPWCRKTVNTRVGHIVRMFKWAASREMVTAEVYRALETLPSLKKGRCAAPDHDPIRPVRVEIVEATKKHVSRQVAALIDLQLLTGSRPGELLRLRASDLDTIQLEIYSIPEIVTRPQRSVHLSMALVDVPRHIHWSNDGRDRERVLGDVARRLRQIEAEQDFPANRGRLCEYCAVRDTCEGRDGRGRLTSNPQDVFDLYLSGRPKNGGAAH